MVKPTLILIRHGETNWNAERRFQGQKDIPLNDRGRRQATENGRTLNSWLAISGHSPSDFRWMASPLARCLETMERVRQSIGADLPDYSTDERLVEISFGDWEGRTSSDLKSGERALWTERHRDKWGFVPPNGESYRDLSERVQGFVADQLADRDELTIIVTHGGVIRTLQGLLLDVVDHRVPELLIVQDRVLLVDREQQRGVWL